MPDDIPVLLDVKRGDIGSTSAAYAQAAFDELGADAVTLSPYMGRDSISPFQRPGKGMFVLCKTSNPGSNDVQTLALSGSGAGTVFEAVAAAAPTWGSPGSIGLVVGATDGNALQRARLAAPPGTWILTPGVGAQGGCLYDVVRLGAEVSEAGAVGSVLVPISRAITNVADGNWAAAAHKFRDELRGACAAVRQGSSAARPIASHSARFLQLALQHDVLRFGSFTLKSGRVSPYFFNAGLFRTGSAVLTLGEVYAAGILATPALASVGSGRRATESGFAFDVLFGPAYKGIPLVTATGAALASTGHDFPLAYDRKEAKDHGEGGRLVGAPVAGKRVLILDDVMSAGTAVRQSIALLREAGAIIAGVVVGLDRQEIGSGHSPSSAVQEVSSEFGIPVVALSTLHDLMYFVANAPAGTPAAQAVAGAGDDLLHRMHAYQARYCVGGAGTALAPAPKEDPQPVPAVATQSPTPQCASKAKSRIPLLAVVGIAAAAALVAFAAKRQTTKQGQGTAGSL